MTDPSPLSTGGGFPWKPVAMTAAVMLGLMVVAAMVLGGGSKPKAPEEAPVVTVARKVTGMSLPEAEQVVRDAGYGFSDEPLNGLFGVQVRENWTVCRAVPQGETSIVAFVGKGGDCSDKRSITELIREKGLEQGLDAVLAPR